MSFHRPDDEAALEPALTASDKKVIRFCAETPRTKWEVSEHLNCEDVAGVRQQLAGLAHLGYLARSLSRDRYLALGKGIAAVIEREDAHLDVDPNQEELAL